MPENTKRKRLPENGSHRYYTFGNRKLKKRPVFPKIIESDFFCVAGGGVNTFVVLYPYFCQTVMKNRQMLRIIQPTAAGTICFNVYFCFMNLQIRSPER